MPIKSVLVTGELGFLGSQLLRVLEHGFEVIPFLGDITDREYCLKRVGDVRPDVIVHLAALSLPLQCDENPKMAIEVNVEGTRNVVDAASRTGKSVHLIFTSTAQVYDYQELSKGNPVDESGVVRPQNLYAETKWEAEKLLKESVSRSNVSVTVLRLFNHVHKNQRSATFMSSVYAQIQKIIKDGSKTGKVVTGNLDLYRELNPTQVLVMILRRLIELNPPSKFDVYNICSGHSRHLLSVARAFEQFFALRLDFVEDKNLLRKNDPFKVVGSNAKIRRILSIEYPKLSDLEIVKYFCMDV